MIRIDAQYLPINDAKDLRLVEWFHLPIERSMTVRIPSPWDLVSSTLPQPRGVRSVRSVPSQLHVMSSLRHKIEVLS